MLTEKDERLEAFEKMLAAVEEKYAETVSKMEKLKAEGKTKSATYMQLMGEKMQLKNMLAMYNIYGLTENGGK